MRFDTTRLPSPSRRTVSRRVSRSKRLVVMTARLAEGGSVRVDHLSQEFSVHRRTIMRDLRELRESGLGIVYFSLEERYRLVNIDF